MIVDSTLTFAARRNVPVRYNRDLVEKTLHTMKRVSEIRARRERVFTRERLTKHKARHLAEDRRLVEENQHLLPPSERTIKSAIYDVAEEDIEGSMPLESAIGGVLDQEMDSDIDMVSDEDDSDMESEEEIKKPVKMQTKQKLKMKRGGGLST
jgi:large subunit ribosomal protein L24e